MATLKKQDPKILNVYFKPQSFYVEEPSGLKAGDQEVYDEVRLWYERFQENSIHALYELGFLGKKPWFSKGLTFLHRISDDFFTTLTKEPGLEFLREDVSLSLSDDRASNLLKEVPFVLGMEYITTDYLQKLFNQLLDIFREEIKVYDGTVESYLKGKNPDMSVAGRVFFHLVESEEEEYPFAFMATYSNKPVKSRRTIHTPLQHALEEFREDPDNLLRLMTTVKKAAKKSILVDSLLRSGELFSPLKFSSDEAYTFLSEVPIYEELGIMCRVPDWWRKKRNSLKVSITIGDEKREKLNFDALMDFKPEVLVDDLSLSEDEVRSFLTMAEGLTYYKGKWIEINEEKLQKVLEAFEKVQERNQRGGLTLFEAMKMELSLDHELSLDQSDEEEVSVFLSQGDYLKKFLEKLKSPELLEEDPLPGSFVGHLRPYQQVGYTWLSTMEDLNFGACLADDMGLGKTVQVIAFLEKIRLEGKKKALLLVPASLIGNWSKEIEKFAPRLKKKILHKSSGASALDVDFTDETFLYMTTYGMAGKIEALKDVPWDILVIDEAQAIKNPKTKQTKSVKAIPAQMRVALTGTPIENQLMDLWSLFDFLNQGLLGTPDEFKTMVKSMESGEENYGKLRGLINPFLLRRLKTDERIIKDLPEKMEMIQYTELTKKQIALYKKLLKELKDSIEGNEGIKRQGAIFAYLMKFKQICNHPDQYLGLEGFKETDSGKFLQLRSLIETIHEKREKVLVFTQFREMTEPLSEFLTEIFGKTGLVLHGGTNIKQRSEMVVAFNEDEHIPYMILSLKAGGVGLNLTAANHVIHFDRWWNPAVEDQATDRAFRIGQKKNVMVYKFVTKGTLEEKIDTVINSKKALASELLPKEREKWITEMDNEEIMNLFSLGGDSDEPISTL